LIKRNDGLGIKANISTFCGIDMPNDILKCPRCGSTHIQSRGEQWRCTECRRSWVKRGEETRERPAPRIPKILLVDIETSPMMVLVWGLFKQHIPVQNVVKEWSILSWAAKWLFEPDVMGEHVSPEDAALRQDKSILPGIWGLLDKADIVIGHNVERFDVRKLNARFKVNGFTPPMPYQTIDTMVHAKRNMAFAGYSMAYLNGLLEKSGKLKTEYSLWKRCIGINATKLQQMKALVEMLRYNKQDVLALEELYLDLRPWMKSHPNLGLFHDGENVTRCPNCGGTDLDWCGEYTTPMNLYRAFRCKCGAIGRDRLSSVTKEQRETLVASVAR